MKIVDVLEDQSLRFFIILLIIISIAFVFCKMFKITDTKVIAGMFVLLDALFYYFDIISVDIAAIGFLTLSILIYVETKKGGYKIESND